MSDIAERLQSQDPDVRVDALNSFFETEDPVKVLPQLTQCVGHTHWKVRHTAAEVFNHVGQQAAGQAQALGALLNHQDPGVTAAAAYALTALGKAAASEAAALEQVLDNSGEDKSTLMLAAAGVALKGAAYLRKPRCAAAMALAAMEEAGLRSIPKLTVLLKHQDADVRGHAATALGNMGKEGAKLESEVSALINDKAPQVQAAGLAALGQMAMSAGASESVATAVAECLTSIHPIVRATAAKSLGEMGDEAQPYLPQLVGLFNDKSPSVVTNAINAVASCGTLGEMYAGLVFRMAYDRRIEVRVAAVLAMPSFGMRGLQYKDEVARLLEDEIADVASAAMEVVQTMEERSKSPLDDEGTMSSVALLFPGQGSQYTKMLAEVYEIPAVAAMLAKSEDILNFNPLDLCLQGSDEDLEKTVNCQPIMYIANLAAMEVLKRDYPGVFEKARAVAGLSLGEYSALCVAGVWDFELGLRLVKVRAEAMQEASATQPQAMVSVAGLSREILDELCRECAGQNGTCQVANCLFPNGFSCAGTRPAMEMLLEKATAADALQAKMLRTSGAFHTPLMRPAQDQLVATLRQFEHQMKPTNMAVYMNLTGQMLPAGTTPSELIPLLADQLCNPVQWQDCMNAMISDGITEFYECGPMKQLKAMMKRINHPAWTNMTNVLV